MGQIVVNQNVTLDGVVQDPTGDEGTKSGGWFTRISEADRAAWAAFGLTEATEAEAFLLGRNTYEYLAARWPARTGAWADRLNSMPKYVVSSTLTDPAWTNTTVLTGDPLDAVAKLKETVDGEIVLPGSGRLVRALMQTDLVDQLRLILFPIVAGGGARIFDETGERKPVRLIGSETLGENLTLLNYRL